MFMVCLFCFLVTSQDMKDFLAITNTHISQKNYIIPGKICSGVENLDLNAGLRSVISKQIILQIVKLKGNVLTLAA